MRLPIHPDFIIDDFQKRLDDSAVRYDAVYKAVANARPKDQLRLRKGLTTDFAFRIGTEWELFQHRWHVASIARSPEVFIRQQQQTLDLFLAKNTAARHILLTLHPDAVQIPSRLTLGTVDALIDPDGYNVTFKDPASWANMTANHLSEEYAAKVKTVVSDRELNCVLVLVKTLRNVLAHGSTASLADLNSAVLMTEGDKGRGLVGDVNRPLARAGTKKIQEPAVYLHAWLHAYELRRVGYLSRRIMAASEALRIDKRPSSLPALETKV
jgi:hypothetical protein